MDNNEKRALNIINQFELVPSLSNRNKIIKLLEQEIDNYHLPKEFLDEYNKECFSAWY